MKKEYQKPNVERIILITEEKITNDPTTINDDYVDGTPGIESNTYF